MESFFLEIDGSSLKYLENVAIPYRMEKNRVIMSNPDGSIEEAEVKFSSDTLLIRNIENDAFTRHLRF